ncbi:D-lactate dehydrogenase [Pontibacter mucosus]|uniref:D-lactate dehydrogenase n=1 Tax=Pontibacter mucosus TaxID=1649266 RepID=A0A2T5Y9P1_9BACT|nr:2-hydroxyacid dehydrogenase [Pontibacter mucosus]PTX13114.1 D-lactate dehydrogenase [Pontibacter mucosus]
MKVALYSSHKFEKDFLEMANGGKHSLVFLGPNLSLSTVRLAQGCDAVSIFVNDDASQPVLEELHEIGIRYVALRSTGYNHVNLRTASALQMRVARVQTYSPYAVAEHSVALMLALNRKLIKAHARVQQLNFSLDGLVGFDMHRKAAGIIGLGKIGKVVAQILHGFGCKILAYDPAPDRHFASRFHIRLTDIDTLCTQSEIVTLHVPLSEQTKYLINAERIEKMKKGTMLINTSRGALIHTKAVIQGLKSGKLGSLGIDVYEEEQGLFFEDHSEEILQDDVIARLMTFQNVLITSHQAFLTDTALQHIAQTTIYNLDCFVQGVVGINELTYTS